MTDLVSLDQAKAHLRVDTDCDDDLITMLVNAAELSTQHFLGRNVYKDSVAMGAAADAGTAGDDPIVVNDLIRAGILLMVGHLYANREDVVTGVTVAKLPVGSEYLLMPYRVKMGV